MSVHRERWFRCTFTAGGERWSTFVRAWDAEQARLELRAAVGPAADRAAISVEPPTPEASLPPSEAWVPP